MQTDDGLQVHTEFAGCANRHRDMANRSAGMTDRFALREHERLTVRTVL